MSVSTIVAITCDGPLLGVDCATPADTADGSLFARRALLRAAGWTRRHHSDRQVDLCPRCSRLAKPVHAHRFPGRPPRARLSAGR